MSEEGVRLQKVMAQAGIGSRRYCEELIVQGRVEVNGRMVTTLGSRARPGDVITVDGRRIGAAEDPVYLLLNKPVGFLSTVSDPRGRRTVLDLVGPTTTRLYPVGRLDYDSSGLLILSNDGEFTHLLTHPRHEVPKTYVATVEGRPGEGALRQLRSGVRLEDGVTWPARVRVIGSSADQTVLEIEIHEGRNRQVRRMCEAVGYPVLRLMRSKIGFLTLKGIEEPGRYRLLIQEEVGRLAGLAHGRDSGGPSRAGRRGPTPR